MIYMTGDTLGEYERLIEDKTIASMTKDDYLIICGNFGFIRSDKNTITGIVENEILDELEQMQYTILFVDGVEENFDLLNAYPVEIWNGGMIHRVRKNIAHLMRGQVFLIDGKKIFTMGGGRSGRLDDYVSEMKMDGSLALPTKTELEDGWKNLIKQGLNVDIVITHMATAEAITANTHLGDRKNYAGELLSFLERVAEQVNYRKWYFGFPRTDMHRGLKDSPLGKYCAEKKMYPVWLKVIPFED